MDTNVQIFYFYGSDARGGQVLMKIAFWQTTDANPVWRNSLDYTGYQVRGTRLWKSCIARDLDIVGNEGPEDIVAEYTGKGYKRLTAEQYEIRKDAILEVIHKTPVAL